MTKEDVMEMVDDDLACSAINIKELMQVLRSNLYIVEAEILKRMTARSATAIAGDKYRIKRSIKREVEWDLPKLLEAHLISEKEGLLGPFEKAFPLKRDCSLRGLKSLQAYGGKTWEAVIRAKKRETEKAIFAYEEL